MENESEWSTNGAIVMIQYSDWKSNETNEEMEQKVKRTLNFESSKKELWRVTNKLSPEQSPLHLVR
jgi:hypothetical protein